MKFRNHQLNYYFAEYIVEAQDMDEKGKFVVVGSVPASETQIVLHGLKDKGNYKFRSVYENKVASKHHFT